MTMGPSPSPEQLEQMEMIKNLDPKMLEIAKNEDGTWDMDKFEELMAKVQEQALTSTQTGTASNEVAEGLEQLQEGFESAPELTMPVARSLPFNLKKAQADWQGQPYVDQQEMQADRMDEMDSLMREENPSNLFFADHAALRDWLEQYDFNSAYHMLSQLVDTDHYTEVEGVQSNTLQTLQESLKAYYESGIEDADIKLEYAKSAYDALPDSVKAQGQNKENILEAPYRQAGQMDYRDHIKTLVEDAEKDIKRLAQDVVTKKKASQKKSFNLSKTAQHHTDQNVILWNDKEKRIDPFLRLPVSDWHVLERNKGFGQDIDGNWDIDWEAIWRGTVMDKYSRPYRDSKTGEWVGGYIQKRFEVDKWIPEDTNIQLMPGEVRKPYIPEYKSLEARMQAMRAKNDRGYGPETDTSAPYNWREAHSSKVQKTAQMETVSPDDFLPPAPAPNITQMDASGIVAGMSPQDKTQFINAYKDGNWAEAMYLLGEIPNMDESAVRMLVDQVYAMLANPAADPGSASELGMVASSKKKSELKVAQRPAGDPFEIKPIKPLDPLGGKAPAPRKEENVCPSCNSEVAANMSVCPNCGAALNNSGTGNFTNYAPDPAKPVQIDPTKNIQLANQLMFDSDTGRFFVTSADISDDDESDIEEIERRKKDFPKLDLVERDSYESKVFDFKGMEEPQHLRRHKVEVDKIRDIEDTMKALEIDG